MGAYAAEAKKSAKPGIDVVLGSQWGDEGKGKLVDMLSQVSCLRRLFFLDGRVRFLIYQESRSAILDACARVHSFENHHWR